MVGHCQKNQIKYYIRVWFTTDTKYGVSVSIKSKCRKDNRSIDFNSKTFTGECIATADTTHKHIQIENLYHFFCDWLYYADFVYDIRCSSRVYTCVCVRIYAAICLSYNRTIHQPIAETQNRRIVIQSNDGWRFTPKIHGKNQNSSP